METFNWEVAKNNYCDLAYNYLLHVHKKNIQSQDFVRGYTSLPHRHCFAEYCHDKERVLIMYTELKQKHGFFVKENFV